MGHTATYDPMVKCIYVYGGSKNLKWFHDVHMLDIDEWKWQLLKVSGKAPTRAYHSATLYRNELWIFGGVYPRPDPQPDGCSNDVHIFSPVMESWYTPIIKGDKPIARSGHSATLMKDQLVVFGGWDAPYVYNDLHILDLSMVEWSQPKVSGTPPNPRSWHASSALSGNRILIHGGYDGNVALDDTHVFCLGT
ncbi:Acyl-CoA-binding domain-containing protein 4 [Mizuhopecten yessoensis]|uniref:Acyl-CoA-binding domain-containing protein 4 n=1 Tax=Mizuhopecten yessoensis TaxID=6573 RepID=A0A210PDQ4_MIZYE|nr:Acyl-CoA-binding domain-containing protein 4 [Mizuhopecten yessoensis]